MSKVTVIGAGNVGATCANAIAHMKICSELVLLDIKEGLSEGKAIDMMQTAKMYGFDTRIKGVTNDYAATRNSNVIVITSGIPRKPGMTREELIGVNAGIVNGVVSNALKYSPNAIFIIISNPMDTMTYLTLKATGLPKNRVIGMGGQLDSNRFCYYLSQALNAAPSDVEGIVIGGHGDTTMIPLLSKATCKSMPVTKLLSKPAGQKVVAATMVGGATLTKLLGTSAWYAPGASCAAMVKSILLDEKKVFPCCCYLEGEYGQEDLCIGVPAVIGRRGCQKILEYDLTAEEKAAFAKSAAAVKNVNNVLYESKILSR
ncbi:MAG: malate dehydrogenase [Bacteroidales bacterium]|jgi:malate dehydrogenase|nr:malate dehydrogenase [Bacteroidales bacterium]